MVRGHPQWLGEAESAKLEYKSSDALQHPETIVRAVVALLNRQGGQVVVGVDDRGVPHGVEDAPRHRDRLQQRLVDAIEPRPLERIEVVDEHAQAVDVLVVRVKAPKGRISRELYAERRHGLYGFWIRTGATTRAYTLSEVRALWGQTPQAEPDRWDEPLRHEQGTVFVLQAQTDGKLDRGAVERVFHRDRRHLLARRRTGFTVVDDEDRLQSARKGSLQVGSKDAWRWLGFDATGGKIRFEGREFLFWKPHPAFPEERVIYPWPLVEGTASFFWLLEQYAQEADLDGEVFCQLGIWRPQGLRLGPYGPGTLNWERPTGWQGPHDNTVIECTRWVQWRDVRSQPDAQAYPFVAEVYEDFGYTAPLPVPFWSEEAKRFSFESV